MTKTDIGLDNLVFLDIPVHTLGPASLAAYTLSAPAISLLQLILGGGNIFSIISNSDENSKHNKGPPSRKIINVAILVLLIVCWFKPGWGRKSGWKGKLFKVLIAVASLAAIKMLGKIINVKLLLLNVIILGYFLWKWWLFDYGWFWPKWFWRGMGWVLLGGGTLFTAVKVLKLPIPSPAQITAQITSKLGKKKI
tara:strand:- start:128 stop:712 length:585 start_codon:yes stop_codon:yes gene_type:complete